MKARPNPVFFVLPLVLAVTLVPYLVAELRPPLGTSFLGTFYYADDFFNYLSYAQQVEDGAFVFHNKVILEDHPPALVNLEWWLVGAIGTLLQGRLILAYRVFAVLAAAAFLWVADRWLQRLGVSHDHRLPALLLVATGGGLGGLLFQFTPWSLERCLDVYAGLFPFLGLLANPHFVAGTTLLLLGAWLYEDARTIPQVLLATAVGTALALVRPYDFVLLVAIRGLSVLVHEPVRRWVAALAPLAGLLPVIAYLYFLFYEAPAFAFYAQAPYGFPRRVDFLWALGPALLLAVPGILAEAPPPERRSRTPFLAWIVLSVAVIATKPVHFSLQILAGCGFPMLALGAVGLSRRTRPLMALVITVGFSTSLVCAVLYVLRPNALWLTARENFEITAALRPHCRPGDVVFAPPEVGILAYGLTSCRAFVSHPIAPDYADRLAELGRFAAGSPADRLRILDAARVSLLVLPGDAGPRPVAWLGPEAPFVRTEVVGTGRPYSLYSRAVPGNGILPETPLAPRMP